jgi:hypothetical protein
VIRPSQPGRIEVFVQPRAPATRGNPLLNGRQGRVPQPILP